MNQEQLKALEAYGINIIKVFSDKTPSLHKGELEACYNYSKRFALDELEYRVGDGYAIILGALWKDDKPDYNRWLVGIDVDDSRLAEVLSSLADTWKVKTKRGVHIMFIVNEDIREYIKDSTSASISINDKRVEIYLAKRYFVTYMQGYEEITPFSSIKTITFNELLELRNRIEKLLTLIDVLESFYRNGNRNNILFALEGIFAKSNIPEEEASSYIRAICYYFNDEELKSRLTILARTYQKSERGEKVVGFSLLKELIGEENAIRIARLFSSDIIDILNDNEKRVYNALLKYRDVKMLDHAIACMLVIEYLDYKIRYDAKRKRYYIFDEKERYFKEVDDPAITLYTYCNQITEILLRLQDKVKDDRLRTLIDNALKYYNAEKIHHIPDKLGSFGSIAIEEVIEQDDIINTTHGVYIFGVRDNNNNFIRFSEAPTVPTTLITTNTNTTNTTIPLLDYILISHEEYIQKYKQPLLGVIDAPQLLSASELDNALTKSRFYKFLCELMPDEEDRKFFFMYLACSILLRDHNKAMIALIGKANIGKSQISLALNRLLKGNYITTLSYESILESKKNIVSPEILRLKNARLVEIHEPDISANKQLNSSLIKRLVGYDNIAVRALYSNNVEEVNNRALPIFFTNSYLNLDASDDAVWVRLVPFELERPQTLYENNFGRRVMSDGYERAIFFTLLVKHLVLYFKEHYPRRITPSKKIEERRIEIRSRLDNTYAWFIHRVRERRGAILKVKDAYEDYVKYCQDIYEEPVEIRVFSNRLLKRGYKKVKKQIDGVRSIIFYDIELKDDDNIRNNDNDNDDDNNNDNDIFEKNLPILYLRFIKVTKDSKIVCRLCNTDITNVEEHLSSYHRIRNNNSNSSNVNNAEDNSNKSNNVNNSSNNAITTTNANIINDIANVTVGTSEGPTEKPIENDITSDTVTVAVAVNVRPSAVTTSAKSVPGVLSFSKLFLNSSPSISSSASLFYKKGINIETHETLKTLIANKGEGYITNDITNDVASDIIEEKDRPPPIVNDITSDKRRVASVGYQQKQLLQCQHQHQQYQRKCGVVVDTKSGRAVCMLVRENGSRYVKCLHCNNEYNDMYKLAEHITRLNNGKSWDIVEQKGLLEEFM